MKNLALSLLVGLSTWIATAEDATITKEVAPPPLIVSPVPQAPETTSRPNSSEGNSLAGRISAKRNRTWVMSFGPGLIFYNGPDAKETNSGTIGFSSHFGGVTQLTSDSPFFVGADLGVQFWSFGERSSERSATGLQLLPTAYYNFDWDFTSPFQPYLGVSAGPHVTFSRKDASRTEISVNFEFLIRPGVTFLMAPGLSLNFEPKIGFLGESLVFCPQIAANLFL